MIRWAQRHWAFLLLWGALAAFLLGGSGLVPFHPDETSILFQSRDLEGLLRRPGSLTWQPDSPPGTSLTYRLLNAPLSKYALGLGRLVAGYDPGQLPSDWDWSLSWQENLQRGAYPRSGLLAAARVTSTALVLLALAVVYAVGLRLDGRAVGLLAMAFLGLNALVLVHGRRAMAEGTLLLTVSLLAFGALEAHRHPALAGVLAALALSAKHSAAPLVAAIALAALLPPSGDLRPTRLHWRSALAFGLVFSAAALALNPVLWAHPLAAVGEIFTARRALVARQVADTLAHNPAQLLDTPIKRLAGLIGHVFVTDPQFAEVGNYTGQTLAMEQRYLAVPGHAFLRGTSGGALALSLTMVGMVFAFLAVVRGDHTRRRWLGLLLLATVAQAGALLAFNPLPIQRYYAPLLPFIALWQALALGPLIQAADRLRAGAQSPASESVD